MTHSDQSVGSTSSVLLVSMPWTSLTEPCLGLGLLKAVLDREGIRCRVLHLHLFLLQHLQAHTYNALATVYALNDFLFSGTLDPVVTNLQQRWLREKVRELLDKGEVDPKRFGGSEGVVSMLLHLRNEVLPGWLEVWADEIARHESSLVGFTCMFDQTIASLALARMVKERAPQKMCVLGGYAVRTPTAQMILRSSPWIDAICDGEGEVAVIGLARSAAGEIPLDQVPGIVYRSPSGEPVAAPPPVQVDLDANPAPDYDDFFDDLKRLSKEHLIDVEPRNLPIENSRGCWWGAKHHCVFCGIHDDDMAYRARDAKNVLATMAELQQRYGQNAFRFSDYILPNKYFDTLLPELARLGAPYHLSCEMKANITEERFVLLARAGFEEVQPGIESFNSDVLRKMRKGVSAVQNVYTLLLGRRLGVRVYYNLLYGFPDDEVIEYEQTLAAIPLLFHLAAPATCVPVQITRYAPLQTQPQDFGIERATAEPVYDLVFSREYLECTGFDIEDFCYFFERPFENAPRLQRIYDEIDELMRVWHARVAKQAWLYREGPGGDEGLTIRDGRLEPEKIYRLGPSQSKILAQCERPTSLQILQDANSLLLDVNGVVAELEDLGLLFRDGERLVSLVMSGPHSQVAEKASYKFPASA